MQNWMSSKVAKIARDRTRLPRAIQPVGFYVTGAPVKGKLVRGLPNAIGPFASADMAREFGLRAFAPYTAKTYYQDKPL